jgi:hypothetical protein
VRGLVFDGIAASKSEMTDMPDWKLQALATPVVSASLPIVLHSIQKRTLADLGAIDGRKTAGRVTAPALVVADTSLAERAASTGKIVDALRRAGDVVVLDTATTPRVGDASLFPTPYERRARSRSSCQSALTESKSSSSRSELQATAFYQ